MAIPAGYTQGYNGFFYKTADNSGPYAMDASGQMYLLSGGSGTGPLPGGTATIASVQTAATGTNWATPSAAACVAMDVTNNTGTDIEYRRGGGGTAYPIPDGTSRMIVNISNANQISFRRVDTSNTQVTIALELFA